MNDTQAEKPQAAITPRLTVPLRRAIQRADSRVNVLAASRKQLKGEANPGKIREAIRGAMLADAVRLTLAQEALSCGALYADGARARYQARCRAFGIEPFDEEFRPEAGG